MFMMYPHHYYNGGFFGFSLFPFLVILGVIFLIWAIAARRSDNHDEELDEQDSALEILKKRYARGEITKRQYLEMKKDIG